MMTHKTFLPMLWLLCAVLLQSCSSCQRGKAKNDADLELLPTTFELKSLVDTINLGRDISHATLYEVRLLRASLLAHNGEWINESDLHAALNTQEWYRKLQERIMEDSKIPSKAQLSAEQQAFLDKLNQREAEILKSNFTVPEGYRVNIRNVANPFILEAFDRKMQMALAKNGFLIVPKTYDQFFHVYENNDYHDIPNFVTTDMFMQLFHMYFSSMLITLEQEKLTPMLQNFGVAMHGHMEKLLKNSQDERLQQMAAYNMAYYAIGNALLTGNNRLAVPDKYRATVESEIDKCKSGYDNFSEFLGYTEYKFGYSLFRPRGHYTCNTDLQRYFMAMMWYQTTPVCLYKNDDLRNFILQADVLKKHPEQMKQYRVMTTPIEFIVGEPDNLSVAQLAEEMLRGGYSMQDLLHNDAKLAKLQAVMKQLEEKQNRVKPLEQNTCREKINLMPQRYLVDAEIMLGLVDAQNRPTKRGKPTGLDIFAAFGSKTAENILLNELKEGENWDEYPKRLGKLQEKMKYTDWNKTLYNKWIESLVSLEEANEKYPYFMQTPQWGKKNINAALASWAELKHDVILYGEQPMGVECGGGMPEPITLGYVEPNMAYWNKAIELLDLTYKMLNELGLLSETIERKHETVREQALFLRNISQKELMGTPLSEEEYRQIEIIGASFEWATLDMLKNNDESLENWRDVRGSDKQVAVVADVFTANTSNNPQKTVVYEATGYVNDLYVVVEIQGRLYLTRGAVFSYHEFGRSLNDLRLTDEEWQKELKSKPRHGVPVWMNEIILPSTVLTDNEAVFYSGGC